MTRHTVHVCAVGMACPVGLSAVTACAAMRAGIDRRSEMEYLGNDGQPVVGSHLARLGWDLTRRERWSWLLAYALRDLCQEHGLVLLERTPMLLAIPYDSNGHRPTATEVATDLGKRLGVSLDPANMEVVTEGSFGGFRGLAAARQALLAPSASHRHVVVAAADSFIEARALARLDRERRLLTRTHSDGIIPGEAAACVLLGSERRASLASICGIGLANEPGRLDNDVPLRGQGIAHAARQALAEARLEMHDMCFRLSDAGGEAYDFKEQVLAVSKLLRRNMDAFPLWLGAMTLGDVGCAAGLCNLLTAVAAWRRGYAPGPRAIAYASAANGNRAAVVLEAGTRK
jgi:3-oxoacyl-[acyl-carrier-protein] synthase I